MRLTPDQVGDRIREARLAKGWTHEELARRMGVNWRTVQRWQKGNVPRLAVLTQLADLFGVPQAYFVEPEDSVATLNDLREKVDELAARVDALASALAAAALVPPEQAQATPAQRRRSAT